MGSWNGTCSLTNLPIRPGDRIVQVILAQTGYGLADGYGNTYADDRWTPISIPLRGKYNNYGWIDPDDDPFSLFVMEHMLERLREADPRDKKQGQVDLPDWSQLDTAIHDGEMTLRDEDHGGAAISYRRPRIGHLMVDAVIFDQLLAQGYLRETFFEKDCPFRADNYRFHWSKASATEYLRWRLFANQKYSKADEASEAGEHIRKYLRGMGRMDGQHGLGLHSMFGVVTMADYVMAIFDQQEKNEPYENLLGGLAEILMLNMILSDTRRCWTPAPSGVGSQNQAMPPYRLLHRLVDQRVAEIVREDEKFEAELDQTVAALDKMISGAKG